MDLTFTIPFKKDSDERLENIVTIIKYLKKYFHTNIMVYEQDSVRNFPNIPDVNYEFIQSENILLPRTHILNKMAKMTTTTYIANYDTDVLMCPDQYKIAISLLRENKTDGVFPYDGRFFNFINDNRKKIIDSLDVTGLNEKDGHLNHPNSVGGAIFWNKQKFIEGGMENQNFISWGWEDTERANRFLKLGFRMCRVNGILYHLNHPTSINSSNTSHTAYNENYKEYCKVASMNPAQLREYIKSWGWVRA